MNKPTTHKPVTLKKTITLSMELQTAVTGVVPATTEMKEELDNSIDMLSEISQPPSPRAGAEPPSGTTRNTN